MLSRFRKWRGGWLAVLLASGLAACSSTPTKKLSVYQGEGFEWAETYSRLFDAPPQDTCEAARRALLSQGYVVDMAKTDRLSGRKRFQPEPESHMEIEFHVVCVPDGADGRLSTAYVNAIQDRYALKKSPNAARAELGAIGSFSIPLAGSEDSLVKVASETIPAGKFYDRFFALVQMNLPDTASAASR